MTVQAPTQRASRRVERTVLFGYVVLLAAWLVGADRLGATASGEQFYLVGIVTVIAVQTLWMWANGRDQSARRVAAFAPPRTGGPLALVAPARPWWRTDRAWWLITNVMPIQLWLLARGDFAGHVWLTWFVGIATLIAAVTVVGTIAVVLLDIQRGADLELRPAGLSLPGALGRTELSWEELPSGRLRGRGHSDRLVLRVARRTPQGLFRRRRVTVWFDRYAVAPRFLTGAIRHYLDHPEHRVAIGTDEEYVRLHALLYREPDPFE